jgi:RNA polymerase sigma-19 factor, ECF subfamily
MVNGFQSFSHFFMETKEELLRFLLFRLHCPDTAADLAQETYLRLLSNEQKSPSQSRRALAFSIAGNLVVDHIRKERVRSRFALPPAENDSVLESALNPLPNAENQAITWQDLEQVQCSLNELDEEYRKALFLSTVEGLTYIEIGERMGVSDRIIAKRIAKALKHCQAKRNGKG